MALFMSLKAFTAIASCPGYCEYHFPFLFFPSSHHPPLLFSWLGFLLVVFSIIPLRTLEWIQRCSRYELTRLDSAPKTFEPGSKFIKETAADS